ncbi:hypothetical protein, partial [Romboutsia sp.]|uniref:hypothetical protein n=1 Tax=Romboutsia sp. TaxID=1965302 RepID=UPI003F2FFF6D
MKFIYYVKKATKMLLIGRTNNINLIALELNTMEELAGGSLYYMYTSDTVTNEYIYLYLVNKYKFEIEYTGNSLPIVNTELYNFDFEKNFERFTNVQNIHESLKVPNSKDMINITYSQESREHIMLNRGLILEHDKKYTETDGQMEILTLQLTEKDHLTKKNEKDNMFSSVYKLNASYSETPIITVERIDIDGNLVREDLVTGNLNIADGTMDLTFYIDKMMYIKDI